MLMVIIAGHIDLSVGSVAAFAGIVVAQVDERLALARGRSHLLGLAVGAIIGAWQGFWVAYIGVPAFIVTLAGMLLFRGGNQFIGNSTTIPVPASSASSAPASCPSPTSEHRPTCHDAARPARAASRSSGRSSACAGAQAAMGADAAPLWVSIVKLVMLGARRRRRDLPVRQRPGRHQLPDLRHHPRGASRSATRSSPATRRSAGTSTRSAATAAPPSCPASRSGGSTSSS